MTKFYQLKSNQTEPSQAKPNKTEQNEIRKQYVFLLYVRKQFFLFETSPNLIRNIYQHFSAIELFEFA